MKINVNYSNRPNKSLVRSRIFTITEEIFHPMHQHDENLSFITFSGYRFIDSIGFYKQFNIRNIYSIEKYKRTHIRSKFNKPYEFIDITSGTIVDFIDKKLHKIIKSKKILFLDYESRFNDEIISDLVTLFSSNFFDNETLLFITFNRGFNRKKMTSEVLKIVPLKIIEAEAYKNWLSQDFSGFIFANLQRKYRNNKTLNEILKVFYRDTAKMVVFGYHIKDAKNGDELFTAIREEVFALPELTFLERNHILNHLKDNPKKIAEELGLTEKDIKEYITYS